MDMPDLSEWNKLNALAMQHREGWRVFHQDEHSEIRYEMSPLPTGQVAMRMKAAYLCGDNHRVSIPWRLYPTRNQALRAFLDQAQKNFSIPAMSSDHKPVQKRMLALLKPLDPGFQEPEPELVHEVTPVQTQLERVKERREKPLQKELF